jgi:hypothetical protein
MEVWPHHFQHASMSQQKNDPKEEAARYKGEKGITS